MNLPEEVVLQLNSKVQRINVLRKLVMQERVNLKAKGLGAGDDAQIDDINNEIREFLLGLLSQELGTGEAPDPFAAIGIEMTPEKAEALDRLLERMTAPKPVSAPPTPAPQEPGSDETDPPAAPVVPPKPRVPGQRVLSPVLQALKQEAGGDDEWTKLPPEERASRIKALERQATITYPATK